MREVRMTFGEHLEELRSCLIRAIIFLLVAVTVCLIFGEELMRAALRPHEAAIEAALRDQATRRLSAAMDDLARLRAGDQVGDDIVTLEAEAVQWEVLFAKDLAVPGLAELLEDAAAATSRDLEAVDAFVPSQRQVLDRLLKSLATRFAESVSTHFVSDLETAQIRDVSALVAEVERLLVSAHELYGPNSAQVALGLGEDLGEVVGQYREFTAFLEERRDEAAKSGVALEELRARVLESQLPAYLQRRLGETKRDIEAILKPSVNLIMIHYLESFITYLKVAGIFGLGLSLPFVLYELWKFVGAGLYDHEQKYVVIFLPISLGLFVAGVLFGYFIMIPLGLQFLASWGVQEVSLSITLGNYIGLFLTLTILMGLVFQVPLLMIFLSKIGIIDAAGFRRHRKPAIFFGFCAAAMLTPPDPITLLLMAGPLILLYEAGILASDLMAKKEERDAAS